MGVTDELSRLWPMTWLAWGIGILLGAWMGAGAGLLLSVRDMRAAIVLMPVCTVCGAVLGGKIGEEILRMVAS